MSIDRRRVGVFHPGTQHSWQTALAFQESGELGWYATSVFYDPRKFPYSLPEYLPDVLGARLRRRLMRRAHPDLMLENVRTFGFSEWVESGLRYVGAERWAAKVDAIGNNRFGRQVGRVISKEPVDVLWGFNNSSLTAFREAKKQGIRCVLDQTIGHPVALAAAMRKQYEAYGEYFLVPLSASSAGSEAVNNAELEMADVVVVGSDFCAETIPSAYRQKVVVVPYGHEPIFSAAPKRLAKGVPHFIFVGSVHPRKGVPQLVEAFSRLEGRARLTLVGPIGISAAATRRISQLDNVSLIGGVPRTEVARHLSGADFFIFPSLFEGGGIVLYEAAAAALPIIQSRYCGDGCNGLNGVVLKEVSVEEIYRSVIEVSSWTDDKYFEASTASTMLAGARRWADYRQAVRQLVKDLG